jgi:hypothetical protein
LRGEICGAACPPKPWRRRKRQQSSVGVGNGDAAPPPEIRAHRASRDASNFDLPSRGRLRSRSGRGHPIAKRHAL